MGYAVEDLLKLGFEKLLKFVAASDAGAEGALAEVFKHDGSGGRPEVLCSTGSGLGTASGVVAGCSGCCSGLSRLPKRENAILMLV